MNRALGSNNHQGLFNPEKTEFNFLYFMQILYHPKCYTLATGCWLYHAQAVLTDHAQLKCKEETRETLTFLLQAHENCTNTEATKVGTSFT